MGYSRAAEQYIDRIQQNPQWGYNVRGILDDNIARGTTYKGVKVIGSVGNLLYILPENKLDEIAITLGLEEYYKLEKIVSECENPGFIPSLFRIMEILFRRSRTRRIFWDFLLLISVMYRCQTRLMHL